jgi:competence CoiA-like predicted nuclease
MMTTKTGKKKELLYVTAFDKNGVLVKAKDADKAQDYFCPECKDKLILKKSGKTGKGSKRPHFAHYSQSW